MGALVAVAQTVRGEDDPPRVVAVHAARGAAQGAVAGALVGWVLEVTAPARRRGGWTAVARDAWSGAVDGAEAAVDAALPVVERAVELAVDVAELADAARRRAA